jgi:hypothetical protein
LVPFAVVTPADVDQYTLYEVAAPTAAHETVTCPFPATALTLVGADGTRATGVALTSDVSADSPFAFTAVTT